MNDLTAGSKRWQSYLRDCSAVLALTEPMQVSGRVTRVTGLVMEAIGLKLAVGSACNIPLPGGTRIEAEVVGFENDRLFLMPQSDVEGVVPGTRVIRPESRSTAKRTSSSGIRASAARMASVPSRQLTMT